MSTSTDIRKACHIALKRRIKDLMEKQSMTLAEARALARIEMGKGLLEAWVSYAFYCLRNPETPKGGTT